MAFSGTQKTRLGLGGFTRGLYGDFSGKSPPLVRPDFSGQGNLLYTKDGDYYILNTPLNFTTL